MPASGRQGSAYALRHYEYGKRPRDGRQARRAHRDDARRRAGRGAALKTIEGETMKGPEDDLGLDGKVAIVSGGGAVGDGIGNGRAAAILLARAGTKVVVSDLDVKLAERTAEMIKAEGGTAVAEACDATKEADCKRLVDAAVDRWGRLDFLDNNVGIGIRASVVDEKPEEYRRVMQVNVETMLTCITRRYSSGFSSTTLARNIDA